MTNLQQRLADLRRLIEAKEEQSPALVQQLIQFVDDDVDFEASVGRGELEAQTRKAKNIIETNASLAKDITRGREPASNERQVEQQSNKKKASEDVESVYIKGVLVKPGQFDT